MASIIYLNECASTNDEILHYLPTENSELRSVYTFNQTKGKGQYGNYWQTAVNLNIAFTTAIPVKLIKTHDQLFNFHTALILSDFIAIMTKSKVEIKWPNDLIINTKKIAGLLTEKKSVNEISYYIVGIGLNILQEDFQGLSNAGSLLTQTGLQFNLTECAEALHHYLSDHLLKDMSKDDLLRRVNQSLYRKEIISVFEIKGLRQNGIIKEIDKEGFLYIQLESDGLKRFYHKEIHLLY